MKKFKLNIAAFLGFFAFAAPALLTSCSDDPDEENLYTFTGQMMSQYLQSTPDFSLFTEIVERAELMDLLSAYGHYTCFVPTNDAVNAYLAKRGVALSDLTMEDCDTIVRTHLINAVYSVSEMDNGVLPTQNMMRRNVQIDRDFDENGNSVVVVNGSGIVFFEHQDDSVENGIMQPISAVLENSTKSLSSSFALNEYVKIYAAAIKATGFDVTLDAYKDMTYNYKDYDEFYEYKSGSCPLEKAIPPRDKLYGFTAFLVPDKILAEKYNVTDLRSLYNLACSIYDTMYPEDVNKPGHDFENLSDPINPLYRFMAYHLLDRNVQGYNLLTLVDDAGVDKDNVNTTEWYTTMLPHTMMKVEHLTASAFKGNGILGDRYINRRYDLPAEPVSGRTYYTHEGVHVQPKVEGYDINANNGVYFYIDDILKFDEVTRDEIHNCRIRMDFSTIFPEIMTNSHRMNGTLKGDNVNGINYFYPPGYLKGVKIVGDSKFVYRCPRPGFYSMYGDEMIAQDVFDITFNLPPIPFTGDWQIRLGFSPMSKDDGAERGQVQVYIDGVAQGIPLNMEENLKAQSVYGTTTFPSYNAIRDDAEARQEDFKILKNRGYYRAPYSVLRAYDGTSPEHFSQNEHMARKILATLHLEAGKTHTLRIKNVSTVLPKKKEAMLDYLELVPKSVYGVSDGANAEDDL